MTFANHLERQLMRRLRGAGWGNASTLPPSPRLVQTLLKKAGSEQQTQAEPFFCLMPRRRTDVLITEYSPSLSRPSNLSIDEMIDGLIASGFVPHLLTFSGGIAQIDRSDLQGVEHQADVIWTR